MPNIIFIHGLESSGQGFTPDISYKALLRERMAQLYTILDRKEPWILIGSSFGGLMGVTYTCQFPKKVSRLILLAPVLSTPDLNPKKLQPIDIPVIVFHGKNDQIVPLKPSRSRAKKLFTNLAYNVVDDDHMLHQTVKAIDWHDLILNS